jgi:hypothetical protein
MSNKKNLGQFFTTNSEYILKGFESAVSGKIVMDPFAGGGDLLRWAEKFGATATSGLDIDPKLVSTKISLNDSLASIPHAGFIITNPPYLGTNKMSPSQKQKIDMGGYEDMYLLSMKKIIEANPDEGIIIIPVNFFSAENSDALRKEFLTQFSVRRVNYFKEQVFEDTTYNVVAFHYVKKIAPSSKQEIEIVSFPGGYSKFFDLEEKYDYRIAGKELNKFLQTPQLKTIRLTEAHMLKNQGDRKVAALFNDKNTPQEYFVSSSFKKKLRNNIILLNCIDTNASEDGWIKVEDVRTLGYNCLVGKNTSRNIAYVMLPDVPVDLQEKIIPMVNQRLNYLRKKYNSLFLTNFRDNDRKRVSFDFCYKLISYCHEELKDKNE